MSFNYEQSIWGRGTATLKPSDPTSIRLRQALAALEQVPDGAIILEVGAGAGQFIRAIKQVRPEMICAGCDISVEAIAQAKAARDGVDYKISAENGLPYEDGSIDVVLIFDVLEHVQQPELFLKEIKRVLKPNGLFYAFVPCEGDWLSYWHCLRMVGIGIDLTKKYAGHINYFSRKSLGKLIKNSGFDFVRVRFSEHYLGQWLGIVAFFMLDRAAKQQGIVQINNETYFQAQPKTGFIVTFKRLINILVYGESALFSHLPSPNVHLLAQKQR